MTHWPCAIRIGSAPRTVLPAPEITGAGPVRATSGLKPALKAVALFLVCTALGVGAAARPASAATPDEVHKAIEKAKAYLYSTVQGTKKDNWEIVEKPDKSDKEQFHVTRWQWGGPTACAIYGLLAGGENPQDPRLAPAIAWLGKQELHGHYAIAMRAQMYPFLPDPTASEAKTPGTLSRKQMAERDAHTLTHDMYASGENAGLYSYYTDDNWVPQKNWCDMSVSQISVLGVWACEQAGADVPASYWQAVDAAWRKYQHPDGSWPYTPGKPEARGSMTAAGVATLHITQEYLMMNAGFNVCRGGSRNDNIDRGLDWIDKNIGGLLQSSGEYGLYQMYGIERIGVASGRKYFGAVDWGAVGADYLVKHQNRDGSFGNVDQFHDPLKVPDTTFAILFLVRGRAPVIMNKLEYGESPPAATATLALAPAGAVKPAVPPLRLTGTGPAPNGPFDPWNERPRDIANFAHWSGYQLETFFTWQIVNLKVRPDELLDAPILYISGSQPLAFNDEEVKKLREFAEDGGLILGNADCANAGFTKSFIDLGKKLFPKYEFRELPPNHIIFAGENFRPGKWKTRPTLSGVSNGVRELMLLIPDADPSRSWQVRSDVSRLDMFQFGFNIYQYTGASLNTATRPDPYFVKLDPNVQVPENRKIKLIRLAVDENPDPEPGGWRRLANILHNQAKVDLVLETAKLGDGKLKGAKLAHITGTTRFKLNAGQLKELRNFVDDGGTLIVDAAGGSTDFASSAEKALAAAFGGTPDNFGTILPPKHDVYTLNGAKIDRFDYRRYCRGKINGHLNVPRIRGLEEGDRIQVFYSAEDLSAGLVGQPTDGILGYDSDTAVNLMRNMILISALGNKAMLATAGGK
jgi:hypothetical protein